MISKNNSSGLSLTAVIFIVFLILKLTENIDWSWWWITSPLWIPIAFVLSIFFIEIFLLVVKTHYAVNCCSTRKYFALKSSILNSTCEIPCVDTFNITDVASLLAVKISFKYFAEKEIGLTSPSNDLVAVNVTLFVEIEE